MSESESTIDEYIYTCYEDQAERMWMWSNGDKLQLHEELSNVRVVFKLKATLQGSYVRTAVSKEQE